MSYTRFTDDKKTDLARKLNFDYAINHPTLFADGNRIIFPVVSGILPTPGATKLRLKAKISLRIAANEASLEKNGLLIKEQSSVKVGPFELKLGSNIRVQIDGQEAAKTIDVQLNYSDNILKKVEFLAADGKVMPSTLSSQSSGSGQPVSFTHNYSIQGRFAPTGVRIVYYDKSEVVTVPFDVTVGLGL